jgi:pyridoxamine 5'-phosphate oxidase
MALATVGADGTPSVRMVLLKGVDRRGFAFFTNDGSDKGRDLAGDPRAALVFRWAPLQRQVRITGLAAKVTVAESDGYFRSRPRESQLGAWASAQSAVIADRGVLEAALAEATARFDGRDVPRPPSWGGYRLAPATVELWESRPGRLHDRLRYRRSGPRWLIERLSP